MSGQKTNDKREERLQRILSAGFDVVAARGADHTSISDVAAKAEVTRPTIYNYVGDIDGLFAEMWLANGAEFLRNLADPQAEFLVGESSKAQVLAELLAISHRNREVEEVVLAIARDWWLEQSESSAVEKAMVVWRVALRLGAVLSLPVLKSADFARAVVDAATSAAPAGQSHEAIATPAIDLPETRESKPSSDPEQRLIDSAIAIISSSGVPATSMARIARISGLSSAAAYARFENAFAVVIQSYGQVAASIIEENLGIASSTSFNPQSYGAFLRHGLSAERKVWRNYRLEMHVEARVNAELRDYLRTQFNEANAKVLPGLVKFNVDSQGMEAALAIIHFLGIGLGVLQSAGIPVRDLPHEAAAAGVIQSLSA